MIYKTFEQWMDGNFLEVKEPRKKAYSKDELLLVEMGWNYGYDAGRAVEQALDKKAENARELGLDYEPADGTQVSKVWWDGEKLMAKPIPLEDIYLPALECTRSHPHENMDAMCQLRTEIARLTNENARLKAQPAPVREPHWHWFDAPVKTYWGDETVVADLAIDKDNTVSIYCVRDQIAKVEAMFTPPAAQRQWVRLTVEEKNEITWGKTIYEILELFEAKLKEKNT